ncbi:serine hydrolase [Siphonobacter sp. SORGH_AS_1065]|uniref:serine hydrolase domain-containing protein n=1 Tax=Siphonobacter sp. SORGH_AS_1065 TaxID=3041795 RepID=UPI00277D7A67|nr:serine hydrolase [Siphonobacter sp. SORGH_AS_1065]MDQ1090345.1 CubicO group peptidase (beta-lactamase class C family) [Siphonobacter sp. SORGH_AS_1065]
MPLNRREFLKQAGFLTAQAGLLSSLPVWAVSPGSAFPRTTPEAQGVSSEGLLNFIQTVENEKLNLHSLMILRKGKVIAEGWWKPYQADLKHTLYSLSKSFTSTAIGFAVSEKRLRVEDKILSFFPDKAPTSVSANLAAMRVKDLLTMSTGHDKDTTGPISQTDDWVKAFFEQPVQHQPGTFYFYNSGATYMLSALIEKLTGEKLLDYLTPRLFKPLDITGADWEIDPRGINTGGWGLRLRTEDIAKFGQLYLQEGKWQGKQLIPADWIKEATQAQVESKGGNQPKESNDWLQGYGYQFWRCRHNAYRGDGAFGQFCIVIPEKEMVVVTTSESGNMQGILNAVWNHILPAVGQSGSAGVQQELKKKLTSLALPLTPGSPTSPLAATLSGKKISVESNAQGISQVQLNFHGKDFTLMLKDGTREHRIEGGIGYWKLGSTSLPLTALKLTRSTLPKELPTRLATSGAWSDEQTFLITLRYIESAHYDTLRVHIEGDKVTLKFRRSLSIIDNIEDKRPVLEGRLA